MEFSGEFETHITVRFTPSEDIVDLKAWAKAHGMKCLHILLDRGEAPSQPMLTHWGKGSLSQQKAIAESLCQDLTSAGFTVTRLKMEGSPENEDVPQSPMDAARHPLERHFEHHLKLLLTPAADISSLTDIAQQHHAHLSRNALRTRSDAYQERFVTQRCCGVGLPEARQQLEALVTALTIQGYRILEVEQEFVVYDTNLALDAGWLNT